MSGGERRRIRGQSDRRDRVALLFSQGRDRTLLTDWLSSLGQYEVSAASDPEDLPAEFDVCIVDHEYIETSGNVLAEIQQRDEIGYLPVIATEPSNEVDEDRAIQLAERYGVELSDVISLPVPKAILARRIDNVLRARRASVRLSEQKDQYRGLVDLMPEGIALVSGDEIAYANSTMAQMVGGDGIENVVGRSYRDFCTSEDVSKLDTLLDEIRDPGTNPEFVELKMKKLTGQPVEASVGGVTVTFEGSPVVQLVVRDLTEEKRRLKRLDLFGRAVESAAQGITIADARQDDEPLIYANDAFEQISGYCIEEVLGRNCRFMQGENTDPDTVAEIGSAIESRQPVSVEILNYRKDGTPFWNRLDIVPVEDEDGRVSHFLGLQRDVTEQIEREQRLLVLDRVLRHNIRNNVGVITGYAERLHAVEDELVQNAAEAIEASAAELLEITEQVRQFNSVITAERRDVVQMDLVRVVRADVDSLREEEPDATVDCTMPESAVICAQEGLELAFEKLLSLATVGGPPDLAITVTEDGSNTVTLELRDRGQTIPESDLTTMERRSETPLEHPRGLEMWLIRWAVEYPGGEFDVEFDDDPVIRMSFDADCEDGQ